VKFIHRAFIFLLPFHAMIPPIPPTGGSFPFLSNPLPRSILNGQVLSGYFIFKPLPWISAGRAATYLYFFMGRNLSASCLPDLDTMHAGSPNSAFVVPISHFLPEWTQNYETRTLGLLYDKRGPVATAPIWWAPVPPSPLYEPRHYPTSPSRIEIVTNLSYHLKISSSSSLLWLQGQKAQEDEPW
jgi:hypothetical protein